MGLGQNPSGSPNGPSRFPFSFGAFLLISPLTFAFFPILQQNAERAERNRNPGTARRSHQDAPAPPSLTLGCISIVTSSTPQIAFYALHALSALACCLFLPSSFGLSSYHTTSTPALFYISAAFWHLFPVLSPSSFRSCRIVKECELDCTRKPTQFKARRRGASKRPKNDPKPPQEPKNWVLPQAKTS